MKEIWKYINENGVKPNTYQISNLGNVRSYATNKWKPLAKTFIKKNGEYGHLVTRLGVGSKHYSVHRLVAKAFIPNPDNKPEINHIDNNTRNNIVTNLEWVTHAENMQHCHAQGKGFMNTRRPVKSINILTGEEKEFASAREGSAHTGVDYRCVSACCHGRHKTAGNYIWRFIQ